MSIKLSSPFHSWCEVISGKKGKNTQNCVTFAFKNIVMQIRKGHCEKGDYSLSTVVVTLSQ